MASHLFSCDWRPVTGEHAERQWDATVDMEIGCDDVAMAAANRDAGVLGLCCTRCRHPVCVAHDLLEEKFISTDAVYAYELDLLDQTIFCYRATNPDGDSHDIARIRADRLIGLELMSARSGANINALQALDADGDTWFPGRVARAAVCKGCKVHLGWSFGEDEIPEHHALMECEARAAAASMRVMPREAEPGEVPGLLHEPELGKELTALREIVTDRRLGFLGLIVTRLRPRRLTYLDVQRLEKQADHERLLLQQEPPYRSVVPHPNRKMEKYLHMLERTDFRDPWSSYKLPEFLQSNNSNAPAASSQKRSREEMGGNGHGGDHDAVADEKEAATRAVAAAAGAAEA